MTNRKSLLALGASAFAPLAAVADATPAYESAATEVQSALTGAITTLTPIVVAIVVAGVALWLVPRAVRLVKGAFSSGTGR